MAWVNVFMRRAWIYWIITHIETKLDFADRAHGPASADKAY